MSSLFPNGDGTRNNTGKRCYVACATIDEVKAQERALKANASACFSEIRTPRSAIRPLKGNLGQHRCGAWGRLRLRWRLRASPDGWRGSMGACGVSSEVASGDLRSRRPDLPATLSGKQRREAMSKASGLVLETPTAELPFKPVISQDGQTIEEQHFSSREEAEVYIVNTLKGFDDLPSEEEDLK
jgi:hypothetical protein